MRLGQLARQLKVTPKDILNHIEKNFDVEIKTHPNSKIPDELIEPICSVFGTIETEETLIETETNVKPKPKTEILPEVKVTPPVTEIIETDLTEEVGPPEKVETEIPVIEGPKVIGKIELSESDMNRKKQEPRVKRERPKRVREKPTRVRKNDKVKRVLTDEEKKKRELKKLSVIRKASEESLKQLNKEQYLKKLKQIELAKAAKAKKKKKKATPKPKFTESNSKTLAQKQKPKGVFGKLWSWLNDA